MSESITPVSRAVSDVLTQHLSANAAEDCSDPGLWRVATSSDADAQWEPNLQYIHAAACSTLYGDSLDPDLQDAYRRTVHEHVLARLEPSPTPPTAEPVPTTAPTTEPAVLDDGQRHWLNLQVGAGTEIEQTFRDQYCPMHQEGLENYAEVIGRQGGLTTEQVMVWFAEWCGS